ncbi:sigma-70 family RNA polymerase sigma factor [Pseudonocardia xinjiangensis]|uniref:sigma-70 family RNA polymerase sigma factor n=1 Tax=Pseudonocardia xinjiangensis TaxID=75289 RepID=UPI003D90233A
MDAGKAPVVRILVADGYITVALCGPARQVSDVQALCAELEAASELCSSTGTVVLDLSACPVLEDEAAAAVRHVLARIHAWTRCDVELRRSPDRVRADIRRLPVERPVVAETPGGERCMSEEDQRWVRGLTATGREYERTVAKLYPLLLVPARAEAAGRLRRTLDVRGPEIDDIACQAAADAVVSIIRKVPEFRGEATFTTWAHRFVLTEVATKVNRHFWRRCDASLDAPDRGDLPARREFQPEIVAEFRDMLAVVARAVDVALSDRQRDALLAAVLGGMSPEALGQQRSSSRNAVYKVVYDARRKLRSALAMEGYLGTG